jgi:hypothetical protein
MKRDRTRPHDTTTTAIAFGMMCGAEETGLEAYRAHRDSCAACAAAVIAWQQRCAERTYAALPFEVSGSA